MSRYRVVIVKLEEPDGTVIEKKWAVYDSESGVVLIKRYDLPFDAENEATALNEELEAANAELLENLKGFTDDPEHPGPNP
ncbi:hypothetical protein AB4T09_001750 [Salmonella enterica]|jgi:phosphoribosylformylglycinamidine (FGAM) synthase PurS component|nr:hypothetical protein [Salmonella enterica]EBM9946279.1 hypothetical protein [Salmonella enterica subsp. enterica serovar Give]ECT8081527.1 hypothetical protein [Salmonella enterica subsp. enterica serovar Carrau]ECU9586222.1 hypothetical protein [Salmonella enterica subsp. enterica serovar Gaminara]EDQ6228622.1 hypothetical protein [Salmonella enterica subsp. enterica serovar Tucson]EDQ6554827.1 hypothetical protein [Salmonella enterica subsp. enterica]EIX9391504.1 hypothetical protein [Kl